MADKNNGFLKNVQKSFTQLARDGFAMSFSNIDDIIKGGKEILKSEDIAKGDSSITKIKKLASKYSQEASTNFRDIVSEYGKEETKLKSNKNNPGVFDTDKYNFSEDNLSNVLDVTDTRLQNLIDNGDDYSNDQVFTDHPKIESYTDGKVNKTQTTKRTSVKYKSNTVDASGFLNEMIADSSQKIFSAYNQAFKDKTEATLSQLESDKQYYSTVSSNLGDLLESLGKIETSTTHNDKNKNPETLLKGLLSKDTFKESLPKLFKKYSKEYGGNSLRIRDKKVNARTTKIGKFSDAFSNIVDKSNTILPRIISMAGDSSRFDDKVSDVLDKSVFKLLDKFGGQKGEKVSRGLHEFLKKSPTQSILKLFGLDIGGINKRDMRMAKYRDPSTPVDFDAETHTSINKVIPGYFAKILSKIKGEKEQYLNYQTGKWEDSNTVKDRIMENDTNSVTSDDHFMSLSKDAYILSNGLSEKDSIEDEDIEKFAKEIYSAYANDESNESSSKLENMVDKSGKDIDKNTLASIKTQSKILQTENRSKSGYGYNQHYMGNELNALDDHDQSEKDDSVNAKFAATQSDLMNIKDIIKESMDKFSDSTDAYLSGMKDVLMYINRINAKRKERREQEQINRDKKKQLDDLKKKTEGESAYTRQGIFGNKTSLGDTLDKVKNSRIGQKILGTKTGKKIFDTVENIHKKISTPVNSSTVKKGLGSLFRSSKGAVKSGKIGNILKSPIGKIGGLAAGGMALNHIMKKSKNPNVEEANHGLIGGLWDKITGKDQDGPSYSDYKNGKVSKDSIDGDFTDGKDPFTEAVNSMNNDPANMQKSMLKKLRQAGIPANVINDPKKLSELSESMTPIGLAKQYKKNSSKVREAQKQMDDLEHVIDASGFGDDKDPYVKAFSSTETSDSSDTNDNKSTVDKDRYDKMVDLQKKLMDKNKKLSKNGAALVAGAISASGKDISAEDFISKSKGNSKLNSALSDDSKSVDELAKANIDAIKKITGGNANASDSTSNANNILNGLPDGSDKDKESDNSESSDSSASSSSDNGYEDPYKDSYIAFTSDEIKENIKKVQDAYSSRFDKEKEALKKVQEEAAAKIKKQQEALAKQSAQDVINNNNNSSTNGNGSLNNPTAGDSGLVDDDSILHDIGGGSDPSKPITDENGNLNGNGLAGLVDIISGHNQSALDPDRAEPAQVSQYVIDLTSLVKKTTDIDSLMSDIEKRIVLLNKRGEDYRLPLYRAILAILKNGNDLGTKSRDLHSNINYVMPDYNLKQL